MLYVVLYYVLGGINFLIIMEVAMAIAIPGYPTVGTTLGTLVIASLNFSEFSDNHNFR